MRTSESNSHSISLKLLAFQPLQFSLAYALLLASFLSKTISKMWMRRHTVLISCFDICFPSFWNFNPNKTNVETKLFWKQITKKLKRIFIKINTYDLDEIHNLNEFRFCRNNLPSTYEFIGSFTHKMNVSIF